VPTEKVEIKDLVAVNFRSENMPKSVAQWRISNHIPFAESCARQIWYGHKNDFATFPVDDIKNSACTLYHGTDAYQFLLQLNSGLLSAKVGEPNISGQFYEGWQRLQAEFPDLASSYDTLIQRLTADERLIRGRILSEYQTQRLELSARDVSGFKKGEQILIVGDLSENGSLTTLTDGLARVLSSNGKKASEVAVTHSDPAVLEQIFAHFQDLKAQKKVIPNITKVSFDDFSMACELYDRVYVTHAMEANPEMDQALQSAWRGRVRQDNTLTHMKAAPGNMGLSSEGWNNAGLDQYISPEALRLDMAARARNNDAVLSLAQKAIVSIANLRAEGKQPSWNTLVKVLPEQDGPEPDTL